MCRALCVFCPLADLWRAPRKGAAAPCRALMSLPRYSCGGASPVPLGRPRGTPVCLSDVAPPAHLPSHASIVASPPTPTPLRRVRRLHAWPAHLLPRNNGPIDPVVTRGSLRAGARLGTAELAEAAAAAGRVRPKGRVVVCLRALRRVLLWAFSLVLTGLCSVGHEAPKRR